MTGLGMKRMGRDPFQQAAPQPISVEIRPLAPELTDDQLTAIAEQVAAKLAETVQRQWMRSADAAKYFGIAEVTLHKWRRDGVIDSFQHDNIIVFDVASVRPNAPMKAIG